MAADDVTLTVPRTSAYLGLIRRTVAYVAERAGFDAYDLGEIEIAVNRSATRAIEHAFSAQSLAPHDQLFVRVALTAEALEITLRDHGERPKKSDSADGIDLAAYSAEYDLGGFDDFVVKDFMDEVEFTHRPNVGNELKLVRYLPEPPP